jgi:chaperonin GroES
VKSANNPFQPRPSGSGILKYRSAARIAGMLVNPLKPKEFYMNLRPLHDRVIVKRLDQETKTASGLIIPDAAAEKPDQGEILAVGNGKVQDDGKLRALEVQVGDRVLFGKYSGQTVKVDGQELLVMREEDIMAVLVK